MKLCFIDLDVSSFLNTGFFLLISPFSNPWAALLSPTGFDILLFSFLFSSDGFQFPFIFLTYGLFRILLKFPNIRELIINLTVFIFQLNFAVLKNLFLRLEFF